MSDDRADVLKVGGASGDGRLRPDRMKMVDRTMAQPDPQ
jgi:hypothetical protein